MRPRTVFTRLAAMGAAFLLGGVSLIAPAVPASAQVSLPDYPVPGGWFYSQESRMPDTPPARGYTVVDDAEAAFWTGFRRFGGVEVLGYPVSRRYRYPDAAGDLHQAFQRGILHWRADLGRAELANVFDYFTAHDLDTQLELKGIPRPRPGSDLDFANDAERRMGWLTESRFLARYFFDPVYQVPFDTQEAAWDFFGLPQSFAERPVYMREKANGKFGAPLYLPYVAQRFQKGGLQLFLADDQNDPTVVPGDARKGCLAITAVGRLARSVGAGKLLPGLATQPEPLENPARVHFVVYVPKVTSAGQKTIQFEMVGTGFEPGEPVTIKLTPLPSETQLASALPMVISKVDATDADGSFDQMITARVASYTVGLTGATSAKVLDSQQDPTIDLSQASADSAVGSKATYC